MVCECLSELKAIRAQLVTMPLKTEEINAVTFFSQLQLPLMTIGDFESFNEKLEDAQNFSSAVSSLDLNIKLDNFQLFAIFSFSFLHLGL